MRSSQILTSRTGPAWLPAPVAEARKFAYWGQIVMLVIVVLSAVIGVLSLLRIDATGAYLLVCAVVSILLINLMNTTVFEMIDQGKFKEASDRLLVWGILGLIFSLILPGIFLLFAFIRIQDVFNTQPQQYPTQYYQQQPQYQQTTKNADQHAQPVQEQQPAQQQPPATSDVPPTSGNMGDKSTAQQRDMMKCSKCGTQYPSFMLNCPNCGSAT